MALPMLVQLQLQASTARTAALAVIGSAASAYAPGQRLQLVAVAPAGIALQCLQGWAMSHVMQGLACGSLKQPGAVHSRQQLPMATPLVVQH
jgi:hypothetical protein